MTKDNWSEWLEGQEKAEASLKFSSEIETGVDALRERSKSWSQKNQILLNEMIKNLCEMMDEENEVVFIEQGDVK